MNTQSKLINLTVILALVLGLVSSAIAGLPPAAAQEPVETVTVEVEVPEDTVVPAASTQAVEMTSMGLHDTAEPLPHHCGFTDPVPCCVAGYVYHNGAAVDGANVTIERSAGDTITTATAPDPEGQYPPYYATALPDSVLGEVITVTASYMGLTARQVYTVVDTGQQVDVVFANRGSGVFVDSGQELGSSSSTTVRLGDLDGDGDLDAFIANDGHGQRVWLNDGTGIFTDTGQSLASAKSYEMELADVDGDGDGDLDAFVANGYGAAANKVWLNDGAGNFTDSGQDLSPTDSKAVDMGDLNGDAAILIMAFFV